MTTVKNVQTFLDTIGFSTYTDVDKITIEDDTVTVTLSDIYDDLEQAHEDFAEKFGFKAVETNFELTTQYLVNVPDKGSFGFVNRYSKHHDSYDFTFVIYNKKYAVSGENAEIKDIIPNFIQKSKPKANPVAKEDEVVTFEKQVNGKLVIKQNGKIVAHQG